jgi:hypothetical protein
MVGSSPTMTERKEHLEQKGGKGSKIEPSIKHPKHLLTKLERSN